jgi:hypothetical protein
MAENTLNPGNIRAADLPPRAVIGQAVVAELNDIEQRRGEAPSQLDPKNWIRHCLVK